MTPFLYDTETIVIYYTRVFTLVNSLISLKRVFTILINKEYDDKGKDEFKLDI